MDEAYSFLVNDIGIRDSVIVACSGGPDSMALLSLVVRIKDELGIKVIVAHVNHNVRAESESEKDFVYNYCVSHGLIFEYMKIDDISSDNFECEARNLRYSFFDRLALKYGSRYVLTAHHGDDLMETILMRIVRGSSLKGYGGFSRVSSRGSYMIIRPLIHMTKDEILDYDKNNDISYVVDKTNFLDVHTRNRYRKYVLPLLKHEDVNVHDRFLKFSETLSLYNNFVDGYVDSIIDSVLVDGVLHISKLLEFDRLVILRVISRMFSSYYGDSIYLINYKHVDLVYSVLFSSRPNSFVYLPGGVRGVRSYDLFRLMVCEDVLPYDIDLSDNVIIPNGKNIQMVKKTSLNDNNVIRLSSTDIVLPLRVRSRASGDRMFVKGLNGSRKVKDIFIDCKVPVHDRDIWPIVVDSNNNIVWIPGLKKSKFDRNIDENCDIILRYY